MKIPLAIIRAEQLAKHCIGARFWDCWAGGRLDTEREHWQAGVDGGEIRPGVNTFYGDGIGLYTNSTRAGDGVGFGHAVNGRETLPLIDTVIEFVPGPLALSHPGY